MPGFDVYGHLTFARCISENNVGIFGPIGMNMKNPIKIYNPFLWNWIVGKLSFHKKIKYQRYFNLYTEIILLIPIISIISFSFDCKSYILCIFIYFLTPFSFTSLTIGPRLHEFTPRLFTEMVLNILVLVLYLDINNIYSSLCVVLLSFIVISSSKFGLQVIFLIIFPILIIMQRYNDLIYVAGGSFIMPYILYRDVFLKSILHHIKHLVSYFQKVLEKRIFIHSRNKIKIETKSIKYFITSLLELLKKNAFLSLIIKYPVVIVALVILFKNFDSFSFSDKVFLIIPFIVFFLTSMKYLLFLGESERYLNNIIIIYIMFCFKYISHNTLVIILCYGLIYKICESFLYVKKRFNKSLHDEVFDYLKKVPLSNIAFYPYQAAGGVWRALLETNHKVVFPILQENSSGYEKKYPYFDLSKLSELITNYDVNVLVFDKKKLPSSYNYQIRDFKTEFENKIFKILVKLKS